jgi:hypothetical protein
MRSVGAPYGGQIREVLDRIEGLVVDGLRHGFFEYSLTCEIGKDGRATRDPGGQESQVHDPGGPVTTLN